MRWPPFALNPTRQRWFRLLASLNPPLSAFIDVVLSLIALITWLALLSRFQGVTPTPVTTTTSEAILRSTALKTVHPVCPIGMVRNGHADVAVAKVYLSVVGTVKHVDMLESPSSAVSQAVSHAVAQWTFRPPPPIKGRPIERSAKLTFYFITRGGRCSVLDPSEAPYVGRWPEE